MRVNYSFTKANRKHIFKPLTKIWGFYCGLCFCILFAFKVYLDIQIRQMKDRHSLSGDRQSDIKQRISAVDTEYKRIEMELKMFQLLRDNSASLRSQIYNILRMVPDQVTLHDVSIEKDRLYMTGVAPSREVFMNTLQLPLKSIFDKSNVSFSVMNNGWYSFRSVNRIIASSNLENRAKADIAQKVLNESVR